MCSYSRRTPGASGHLSATMRPSTDAAMWQITRGRLSLVADTENAITEVVADQDRPVWHLQHIDGPPSCQSRSCSAAGSSGSSGHEVVHESLVARNATSVRARQHHAIATGRRSVPRSMLSDDRRVLVAGREHVARIEREAERGHVGAELLHRRLGRRAGAARAELRIRHITLMAEWKAEVEAGLPGDIEFVVRQVVAEHVATVIGEPQLARL